MKSVYLIPLLFLSACSTTPKVTLRPQPSLPMAEAIRYPEVLRAYHFGRYVDPNDDLVMHEQHTVFRVEENSRWDLHPGRGGNEFILPPSPQDVAFSPTPVNDAVLAEVNAQKLATVQILMQGRSLSAMLGQLQSALQQTKTNLQETAVMRVAVGNLKQRLDALESSPEQPVQFPASTISTTNAPIDPLEP